MENTNDIHTKILPLLKESAGKTLVIKYGGHAMTDLRLKEDFAADMVFLKKHGINPVIVHGGGPQISRALERAGVESRFIRGMRVTDGPVMEVVESVLSGTVNKEIAALITQKGGNAVGISGRDAGLVNAEKLMMTVEDVETGGSEHVDLGFVGKIKKVNPEIITALSAAGFLPVISPVCAGEDAGTYNVNADLVAAGVASALGADRLIFLTDVNGVLDAGGETIPSITPELAEKMIDNGDITAGMIPKIECCLTALKSGTGRVDMTNGKIRHSILTLFIKNDKGTKISND